MTSNGAFSWAEQIEELDTSKVSRSIKDIKHLRTVTEITTKEDGRKIKTTTEYAIKKVSKSVADLINSRKSWRKYGAAARDKPGPNSATTTRADDVFMQFDFDSEDGKSAIKKKPGASAVKCRICQGDHWSAQCPNKEIMELQETEVKKKPVVEDKGKEGKYVPPSLRGLERGKGETMDSGKEDWSTLRVSNLSESATEEDLQELFKPFGKIARVFVGRDKITGWSKGFAFVNFWRRDEAAKALAAVNGFGYDHLILSVEWAKPSPKK